MPCDVKRDEKGITMIACSRGGRRALCNACGKRPHAVLCDYPLRGARAGQTCDAKVCGGCAVHVGPDRDYCPAHAKVAREAGEIP